jgi:carboxyl-terminal processing protease
VFDAVSSHGGGAAFWTDNVTHHYTAPVVVLVSENTGSAAEGFAWYMRTRTHAQLIGRKTAGALLSAEAFDLGDGWHVTIPVHGLWGADGTDWGDQAVPPHQTIARTRADLCAGRDPDMAAAFHALGD